MSLQRTKLAESNAVVNEENRSVSSMQTGELLEMFTLDEDGDAGGGAGAGGDDDGDGNEDSVSAAVGSLVPKIAAELGELWDEGEYGIDDNE
jgi:TATA-binding protein-associated factor